MGKEISKERDLKTLQRLLRKAEADQAQACNSLRAVHGFLDRMGERYGEDLGIDVQSVIPKEPD